MPSSVVVGMTGATGQLYGIRALQLLQDTDFDSHLILSSSAKINIEQEAGYDVSAIEGLADEVYSNKNVGAPMASGSFRTTGMLVVPCSMKTLSHIAYGSSGNLITRSADVMLKERRPLGLMPREKPFNRIHLKNMLEVTDAGATVIPPFPSFYQNPDSIEEMVTRTMARALTHVGVDIEYDEWTGLEEDQNPESGADLPQ